MRKIINALISFLALLCCPMESGCQKITGAEYFINTDPGEGNGISINIVSDTSVNVTFTLPVTILQQAFNQLFVRVKDENNNWSIAEQRTFFIDNTVHTLGPLTASEYFIDSDPGVGGGSILNINTGDTLSTVFDINTQSLSIGFHQLFIRVKDQNNNWSIAEQRTFYIDGSLTIVPSPIVAGEYYINKDSASIGNNTSVSIFKGNFIDTSYKYTAANLPIGKYSMNLRVKDSIGNWSIVESRPFTVCTNYGPKADFQFAVEDSSVSFINNSQYASNYHWIFGNGDTSNQVNPYHTFKRGVYNACLISKNECLIKGDTLCKTVSVVGLSSINANHGGNIGQVSVSIKGAGFIPGMQLFLHRSGESDIYGDTLIIGTNSLMTTTFDLTSKTLGNWDVIAIFPNGKADTLHGGFTIEASSPPNLWVNITGARFLRIGFNQVYTLTYGNKGNTDALLVPLLISGLPLGTKIEILEPLFNIKSVPGFDTSNLSLYPISHSINDSAIKTSFRMFFLSKIPAGSTRTLHFIFHVPTTTILHSISNIKIAIGMPLSNRKPLVNLASENNIMNSGRDFAFDTQPLIGCLQEIRKVTGEELLDQFAKLDPTGLAGCYIGMQKNSQKILEYFSTNTINFENVLDASDFDVSVWVGASSCLRAAVTFGTIYFPVFIPAAVALDVSLMAFEEGMDPFGKAIDLAKIQNACTPALKQAASYLWQVIIANVIDPNEKYGVGDSSHLHYTTSSPLTYNINFENVPDANINAQTIKVTDTLNSAFYDYSSFGFNSVTIGDSSYSFINPVKLFAHDFDFTQLYGVKARATATFDTITGIAQWTFLSIDPATNQQSTNSLTGFLPPDINSPKGQGYVSFTVNPASTIKNGDEICNRATIIFDANPPIVTDCWTNVFDLIKPISIVKPLPVQTLKDTFLVNWSGTDNLSGIRSYEVFVSVNDSAFVPWLVDTTSTNAFYIGSYGKRYSFYSIATDNAGNIESAKSVAEATTVIDSSLLPVTLVNFKTECSNQQVLLTWQTATEINSRNFEVQRRNNGSTDWVTIGVLNAAGNSTALKNYAFTDKEGFRSSLYRLRQNDKDGQATFSQALLPNCHFSGTTIEVYPIPAKSIMNILIQTDKTGNATILLLDELGKIIRRQDKILRPGSNSLLLNISSVSDGTYFLKVEGTAETITKKVIINH